MLQKLLGGDNPIFHTRSGWGAEDVCGTGPNWKSGTPALCGEGLSVAYVAVPVTGPHAFAAVVRREGLSVALMAVPVSGPHVFAEKA